MRRPPEAMVVWWIMDSGIGGLVDCSKSSQGKEFCVAGGPGEAFLFCAFRSKKGGGQFPNKGFAADDCTVGPKANTTGHDQVKRWSPERFSHSGFNFVFVQLPFCRRHARKAGAEFVQNLLIGETGDRCIINSLEIAQI